MSTKRSLSAHRARSAVALNADVAVRSYRRANNAAAIAVLFAVVAIVAAVAAVLARVWP